MTGVVFLDFEASSLGRRSYPIEVAWVFDTGQEESYLIRPAPGWTDWAADAERIHGIARETLAAGTRHDDVARRMVDRLSGHDLYATAPSWDGQWLSKLLRAAGLPRHALRLRDTEDAHRSTVLAVLDRAGVPAPDQRRILGEVLADAARDSAGAGPPAHRALADARQEYELWRTIEGLAQAAARTATGR